VFEEGAFLLLLKVCFCTAGLAPTLLEKLQKAELQLPEKLVLSCRVSPGDPEAQISWYRNGASINNDQKYDMTCDADRRSLIIAVSEVTDSATYRCEAVNIFGIVRTECRVFTDRKSRFLRHFRQQLTQLFMLTNDFSYFVTVA